MRVSEPRDVAIVGGGIVGLATARALCLEHGLHPIVLEAENSLAAHQTGHNSGVIHSGLYYAPGSSKARDCVAGRDALYAFCREQGVAHERCGKLVVATSEAEAAVLLELEQRGRANGLDGIRRVAGHAIPDFEPHVRGQAALWLPDTGIVDFSRVAKAFARELWQGGAEIRVGARVRKIERPAGRFILHFDGERVQARRLVNCAGLQCDRVARMCGLDPGLRIVPIRGEYSRLVAGREALIRNLVYPVPDPRLPFLGVHFTRRIDGTVDVGPNAVPAFSRSGYRRGSLSPRDLLSFVTYPGFWRMAARHWRYGAAEMRRSLSKTAFVADARRLVPDLAAADLVRHGCGIRAQAVDPDGSLVADFRILAGDGMVHVLNAPSPAATASLALGRAIAERAVAGGVKS
jgi:L-2-hydroxyglutarate oxidase